MKLQLIAAAVGSVLAFGAYAQSASESGSSSNSSYGSAPSSNCESLTGEERTKCLRDEADNQGSSSTDSSSDSAASGSTSSGSDSTMPTDQTPASKSE